ncbi:MAG: hypothetical protein JW881_22020 [Spirochaetales bacterium]|nr:hypothetical protein [Spirochaetales bacterium]
MQKRLKPEVIRTDAVIRGITGVNIKNSVGALNETGEFCLLEIDEEGNTELNAVLPGHPENKSLNLNSDNEHNIMWIVRGRGVYFLDLESKKTAHITASNDGNGKILSVFTTDPEKRIMGITYTNCPGCAVNLTFYDLKKRETIGEVVLGPGKAFPYYDNTVLCVYTKPDRTRWWFACGYDAKKPEDLFEDRLTRKLTETQMDAWHRSDAIHPAKRILICSVLVNGKAAYFSVRWDEKREKVKVEPLILQRLKNRCFDDVFLFSPKGNWIKTLAFPAGGSAMPPELIMFHTGGAYPQGISLPVLCGYTDEMASGAFMEHEAWGPCYIDWDPDVPEKLFVFRLNEGLRLLADRILGKSG